MPESTQHKLDRIRPPRVQITYDVETRGSFVKIELPFVAGILADLSGNVVDPKRVPLRDRKYVEIDRDNFNDIMKSIGPKVEVKVSDSNNGGSKTLSFENIDDFSPIKVLEQLDAKESFEKRKRLSDIVAKLDGNVKFQQNLLKALIDPDGRKKLKATVDEVNKALAAGKPAEQPGVAEKPAEPQVEGSAETPKETEGGTK